MATLKIETLIKYHKIINSVIQRKPMPMYVFVFIFFWIPLHIRPNHDICVARKKHRVNVDARAAYGKNGYILTCVHMFTSFSVFSFEIGNRVLAQRQHHGLVYIDYIAIGQTIHHCWVTLLSVSGLLDNVFLLEHHANSPRQRSVLRWNLFDQGEVAKLLSWR